MVLLGIGATVEGDTGVVAGVSVPGAFVLAVLALGTFVIYIDHIVHAPGGLRSSTGPETTPAPRSTASSRPHSKRPIPIRQGPFPDGPPEAVHSQRHGNIFEMDVEGMIEWAAAHDAIVILAPAVGDFVPADSPLLHVYGNGDAARLKHRIRLDAERTITDDVGFGIRLVVTSPRVRCPPAPTIRPPQCSASTSCIDAQSPLQPPVYLPGGTGGPTGVSACTSLPRPGTIW